MVSRCGGYGTYVISHLLPIEVIVEDSVRLEQ